MPTDLLTLLSRGGADCDWLCLLSGGGTQPLPSFRGTTMAQHYKQMEKIGEGMFGSVYRARRRLTAQIVALKYIPKKGRTGKEREGLRGEIEILKNLKHDNIILLLDAFETAESFCLVLEYARGELFEVLKQEQRLPELLVQDVARQLVLSLHYLHGRRIIHRDMKPQNVLISANGTVKLCDFGFARSDVNRAALMKSIKGTPLYVRCHCKRLRRHAESAIL